MRYPWLGRYLLHFVASLCYWRHDARRSNFLDSLGSEAQIFRPATALQQQQHQQQAQQLAQEVNSTEKFFLTAADPSDGRLEDRLTEVINAKYEAGFLKPYNYVNGYARLQKYMDSK